MISYEGSDGGQPRGHVGAARQVRGSQVVVPRVVPGRSVFYGVNELYMSLEVRHTKGNAKPNREGLGTRSQPPISLCSYVNVSSFTYRSVDLIRATISLQVVCFLLTQ